MRRVVDLLLVLASVWSLAEPLRVPAADRHSKPDHLFFNARIFTGEPLQPYADAVGIRGDRIVAVGARAEVVEQLRGKVESTDLQGRTLLPGLIDSHAHAVSGGVTMTAADLAAKCDSIAHLLAFARDARAAGRGMHGDILRITGLPLSYWVKVDELNATFSAGEFSRQPVLIVGMDYHTCWGNQALRERVGLTRDFVRGLPESMAKYFGQGPDQEPNGFAVDAGMKKLTGGMDRPSKAQLLAGARAALRYLNSLGITAWLEPNVGREQLEVYRDLSQSSELTAHVAAIPAVKWSRETEPLAEVKALRKDFKRVRNVTVPGVKVFADGVAEMPSQSAVLSAPYKNTGRNGDLLFEPSRFARLCTDADRLGLLVHVHAIGDGAVTSALDGIETARRKNGPKGPLHSITHLQFVLPEDFPRFRQLGVLCSFQLFWASADVDSIDLLKPYVDPRIYDCLYPARSILHAGGVIAGASDWNVTTPNVFEAIYQAETRRGPKGILNAAECLPREAMLQAYTRNAAMVMGQEKKIGSIKRGKQANLVLVDRDVLTVPPAQLKDTQVLWTMVDGRIVYSRTPSHLSPASNSRD